MKLSAFLRSAALAGISLGTLVSQPSSVWEVISIRPSRTGGDPNVDSAPGGRLTATNITVRELARAPEPAKLAAA